VEFWAYGQGMQAGVCEFQIKRGGGTVCKIGGRIEVYQINSMKIHIPKPPLVSATAKITTQGANVAKETKRSRPGQARGFPRPQTSPSSTVSANVAFCNVSLASSCLPLPFLSACANSLPPSCSHVLTITLLCIP
jgi:hypothetical protein